MYQFIPADYTKSSTTFQETVESNATSFRPLGEKLAAYVRPSGAYIASKLPKGKGKGKGKANGGVIELDVTEDSSDAVVYEVYKVCLGLSPDHLKLYLFLENGMSDKECRRHGVHLGLKNTIAECSSSSCSSSKVVVMFTYVPHPPTTLMFRSNKYRADSSDRRTKTLGSFTSFTNGVNEPKLES